ATIVLQGKLAAVYERLVAAYGVPEWRPDGDALGGLIGTILSQHTSDVNSERAYQRLVERLPTWEAVRDAPVTAVEEAIRPGGLGRLKALRIQAVLRELSARLGAGAPLALAVLDAMPDERAEAYLRTLPGVGPKTAACVLLFALGRPAFPVDTHVLRVCQRLGLVGPRTSGEAAHALLGKAIPPDWRHTLHVTLIRHGRQVCHAQRPACPRCPLRAECAHYWQRMEAGATQE
ncbi:MAG TPA: endonuclease III, partial [Ktedonobacterales bacterium]